MSLNLFQSQFKKTLGSITALNLIAVLQVLFRANAVGDKQQVDNALSLAGDLIDTIRETQEVPVHHMTVKLRIGNDELINWEYSPSVMIWLDNKAIGAFDLPCVHYGATQAQINERMDMIMQMVEDYNRMQGWK